MRFWKVCGNTVIVILALSMTPVLAESEVSRSAPDSWQIFRDELISIDNALKLSPTPDFAAGEGVETEWLVRHRLSRIEVSGDSLVVSHTMRKLLKISAKEKFSTTKVEYYPDLEKVHIVRARTILPDGSIIPVGKEGVFLEQVDFESDTSFSDQKRIRIVFPKTDLGAIIEVVVVREMKPRIPRQWSYQALWKGLSPVRSKKVVVEIPDKLEGKLAWELPGADVKPAKEALADGILRFTWAEEQISDIKYQIAMPSPWQRGPVLRVGLATSWQSFGLWYGGLLRKVNGVTAELESLSKDWAGDAVSMEPIAANLFEKVSQDVRYTGLEFGEGAFQPRQPQDVCVTRYGDCKDKANLLKVLLREHGISSKIALINTRSKGEVPRTVASASLFNHAILAVKLPGKDQLVYCDPTLNGIPFGVLPVSDQGRDVFLVNEDGSFEWGRTEEVDAPGLLMDANLSMEPSGAVSGWFDVKMSGSLGWLVNRQYEQLDRQAKLKDGLNYFFGMIRGIRLVDVEKVASKGQESTPFHYRYYVVKTVPEDDEVTKTMRFKFPVSRHLITTIGPNELRLHSFLMSPLTGGMKVSVALPEGWKVIDQPAAKNYALDGYQLDAGWSIDGQKLQGSVHLEREGVELSVSQHKELASSVRSFAAWLDKPVLMTRSPSDAELDSLTYDPLTLPKMPSPEGFASLVELRFPLDPHFPEQADHEARIAAFKRMQELYSEGNDLAHFMGRTMELYSRMFDYPSEEQIGKIVVQIKKIVQHYEGKVAAEKIAGIEILLIAALMESGENDAAIALSEALLKRKVPEVVKQIASGVLASMIVVEDPKRAAGLFRVGMKNQLMPDDEWLSMAAGLMYCIALLPDGNEEQIEEQMLSVISSWPERREDLKEAFLSNPELLVDYGHHEAGRRFLRALETSKLAYTDEDLEALKNVFSKIDEIQPHLKKITDYLELHPWPDLQEVEEGHVVESATDCLLTYSEDAAVSFRYALRGLVGFGAQAIFADQLATVVLEAESWFQQAKESSKTVAGPPESIEPLLDLLVSVWGEAPDGEDYVAGDAFLAEGDLIGRRKGEKQEEVFFLAVAADEARESDERLQAVGRVQELREKQGDMGRYIESLAMAESFIEDAGWGHHDVLLGAYLSLVSDDFTEAWRKFDLVIAAESDDFSGKAWQKAKALATNREVSEAWWKSSRLWWGKWEELAGQMKIKPESEWSLYTPWKQSSKKALKRVEAIESEKKKKRQLKKILAKQIEFTRWHKNGEKDSLKLLNSIAQHFPKFKDEIVQLIEAIEGEER